MGSVAVLVFACTVDLLRWILFLLLTFLPENICMPRRILLPTFLSTAEKLKHSDWWKRRWWRRLASRALVVTRLPWKIYTSSISQDDDRKRFADEDSRMVWRATRHPSRRCPWAKNQKVSSTANRNHKSAFDAGRREGVSGETGCSLLGKWRHHTYDRHPWRHR